MTRAMNEGQIKAAVLGWVRRRAGRRLPIVTTEYSLNGTGVRADVVVLGDRFTGVEIKSAADSLKRLSSQAAGYARYFDLTQLVVAPRHGQVLADVNLCGAEVWTVDSSGFRQIANGEDRAISGHTLLGLLTAEEERRAAQRATQDGMIDDVLARSAFEAEFRRRYQASSDRFWATVRGRTIQAGDVRLLSRFHDERAARRQLDEQRAAERARWLLAMTGEGALA